MKLFFNQGAWNKNGNKQSLSCVRPLKFIFLLLLSANCFSQNPCGGEYRWEIKILIDSEAKVVWNSGEAIKTSVDSLVSIVRPSNDSLSIGRCGAERSAVVVTGYIVAIGKEEDGDYHLVIKSDSSGKTLIAEIPNNECDDLGDNVMLRATYKIARLAVEFIHHPSSVKPISPIRKVTIVGVPFFDKISHGKGHAENGIEIHPVLKITFE